MRTLERGAKGEPEMSSALHLLHRHCCQRLLSPLRLGGALPVDVALSSASLQAFHLLERPGDPKYQKHERNPIKYWNTFYKNHQDKIGTIWRRIGDTISCYLVRRARLLLILRSCWRVIWVAALSCKKFFILHGGAIGETQWSRWCNSRKVDLCSVHVGCGAGNTLFPLLAAFPDVFVHARDFSPFAIALVKIFMLSAVSPMKMPLALQNVRNVLKPSGTLLFRDYAMGDFAQDKLAKKGQIISNNFYVRGDGTCAFYFSKIHCQPCLKEMASTLWKSVCTANRL
ncbi:LOW QUALITY PROTEIN: tRNA(Thr) (cytosine(32)-N(3))-methyltransferase [Elaeis guineensis]|uniref:LOW QUALITY PROTEIN: tRNA(Thr) (cytosine(32)-N(3))-methyltransferase n=1 Tax=Elaeis guineensis var. tenera TaxID=51953 RepID=UPI003C6CE7D7